MQKAEKKSSWALGRNIKPKDALNLRVCRDGGEILDTLTRMMLEDCPTLIWQNLHGKRKIQHGKLHTIDIEKKVLIFVPISGTKKFRAFDKKQTIYMRGNEKSILFKSEKIRVEAQRIIIPIPKETRMYELRTHDRKHFGHGSRHNSLIVKQINKTSKKLKEFDFNLYDISEVGACFSFSPKESVYFNVGDTFLVLRLGRVDFECPLNATVIYVRRHEITLQQNRQVRMKMGVSFERLIPHQVVNLLA